ncbi:MAG: hypothetical protein K9G67_02345 [Bacteroidales bacterium]|nr:hypothetical protein [Bacteroidales bacterium]MCF8343648.1 hypothetical protein [Bacteroidales bacterium]MCF8375172.1 hypothetical protein [Bacteroidales bacterium]MCF8400706.1 hypothetical protein [Bacteroidales bacterium]
MKQIKYLLTGMFFLCSGLAYAQRPAITLTFSSDNEGQYVDFDSILVTNLDRNCDTSLYYPDTVLHLADYTGIHEQQKPSFFLSGNHPNPFFEKTSFELLIPSGGPVQVQVFDLMGEQLSLYGANLEAGTHLFNFYGTGRSLYILRALWKGEQRTIKMIGSDRNSSHSCKLEYVSSGSLGTDNLKLNTGRNPFSFFAGDQLQCSAHGTEKPSAFVVAPVESDTLIFQFASNIACLSQAVINYEDQEYHTVQIYGQCWMKENLNIGQRIDGEEEQSDNGIIEKYCYDDDPSNCSKFGGMYMWGEMMDYQDEERVRGICPPGWHIPSDAEWKILEGSSDSLHGIYDPVWDAFDFRGYDAGYNLKSDSLWMDNGNGSDKYGFNALPAGTRSNFGDFILLGRNAPFWSSTSWVGEDVLYRVLVYNTDQVYRYSFEKDSGFPVRCLKD